MGGDTTSLETRTVEPTLGLGVPLSATYLPASRAVLVVDEIVLGARGRHERREARLIVLDPATGAAVVVGRWPRTRETTRFALAAAPDGTVYLASSGPRHSHVVARLRLEAGRAIVVGWAVGARPILAGAARASAVGLSLGVEERDGSAGVVGHRASELSRHGRLERCF